MFIIYNKVRSDSAIVVELLTTLKEDSEAKYDDLMKNGVYSIKVKQEYLASIIQTIDEQKVECERKQYQIKTKEQQINDAQQQLNWIENRLKINEQRRKILADLKCSSHQNYVDGIRSSKYSTTIIQYLRKALSSLEGDQLNFAQKLQLIKRVEEFLQKINDVKLEVRPDESEIQLSTNETTDITPEEREQFEQAKKDLLELLNQLEEESERSVDNHQFNEIRSTLTMTNFSEQLVLEDQYLQQDAQIQKTNLEYYQDQLLGIKRSANLCELRLGQLNVSKSLTENDLVESEKVFNQQKIEFVSEFELFKELFEMYQEQVHSEIGLAETKQKQSPEK